MNIINFGSCNIDYVYSVPHFVRPGETLMSKELNRFPGGKGLNQSIAAARSGAKTYHAGCIGTDGEFLKEILKDSNVDVSYLKTVDTPTGHAIIQVDDNGENNIILHCGANHMFTEEYIDNVLSNFSEDDIVLLQNEINNIGYIIDKAYEKNMTIVLNPSPFHKTLTELDLNKISILLLNEVEAFEFSGEKDKEKIIEYFKTNYENMKVVLTFGSKGSIYFDKDTSCYCPIFSVAVKDTTSAGDTFTGYFLSGLIQGHEIDQVLKFASAASALAVSKNGAASSIPYKAEVDEAIKTLKQKNE